MPRQLTVEQCKQALQIVEPGSELDVALEKWSGFEHTVKESGVWRLEGFITWFQNNCELMRAIEPSLEPSLPPQCFDSESIARFFGMPVTELSPSLSKENRGFTDEDRDQLTIVKKFLEGHVATDKTDVLVESVTAGHTAILDQLARVTEKVEGVREELGQHRTTKEWYSPSEVAELLEKAPFTVREWCRLGRVNVRKRPTGRGDAKEWEISHKEIERYRNHGLLPIPKY